MTQNSSTPPLSLPSYVQGLAHRPEVWRTFLAAAGGIGLLVLLSAAAVPVGMVLDKLMGVTPFNVSDPSFTIGFWVAGNLLLGLLIPASTLLCRLVYGAASRTISSVAGRFRWVTLCRATIVVIPVWAVYAVAVQPALGTGAPRWSALNILLCVVAVVTIPLQSAGEEFLFRGLIFRAVGARFARPAISFAVGTTITALQFGLVHGANDPWGVAYYVVMGISFAVLTERTGGLEVPVLIHAVNNTFLLVPVVIAGELSTLSAPTGPVVVIPVVVVAIVTGVLWRMTPWLTQASQQRQEASA